MKVMDVELNNKTLLAAVVVRPIEAHELPRWLELVRAHHYLGFGKSAGKRILYVATIDGEWAALLSWAAAALHVRCRDQWIGWDKAVKRRRLKQITNNTRFLILPGVHVKNLASRVLALNLRRIRATTGMRSMATRSFSPRPSSIPSGTGARAISRKDGRRLV
jgi:hypothetical protein